MKLAYQLERWRRGRLYRTVASTNNSIKHEVRARPPVPWSRRPALWRQGFFAEAQLIYDLTDGDGPAYLTDFQHLRVNSNIAWNWLYKHKLALRGHLLALGVRQTETLACVYHDRVLLQAFSGERRSADAKALRELLRSEPGSTS